VKLRQLLNQMSQIAIDNKLSAPKIVGGAARDKFLNTLNDISDLDITTGDSTINFLVKEVSIALGKDYNFRLKKSPAGHTTLTLGNLKIDFSSHFVIPNIDGILAEMKIEHPTSMEKELYSRDFFCNTLLLGTDLKTITDITKQAIPDLKNKVIRTCLAPEITLTTNKNRVVRAIYLSAKLGFKIDESVISFVRKNPQLVQFASSHTLAEKLNKATQLDIDRTVYYLDQMGLWNYIPISKELQPYYVQRSAK
jgi:poly(A) polymerase